MKFFYENWFKLAITVFLLLIILFLCLVLLEAKKIADGIEVEIVEQVDGGSISLPKLPQLPF